VTASDPAANGRRAIRHAAGAAVVWTFPYFHGVKVNQTLQGHTVLLRGEPFLACQTCVVGCGAEIHF
jgi:hypothetical protein